MNSKIWFTKYEIIKTIGHGGSGDVFLVNHLKLNSKRVIKRISKEHLLHNQLLKEAHILKELRHSLIPLIYDFEEDDRYSYIIEEYIEGVLLSELIARRKIFSLSQILNIGIQLCDLIEYLNSNKTPILYLDLKAENIIIHENLVYLIDFGAASFKSQINKRQYSLGTYGYAPPELFTGKAPDERADIYGIGTLLYYLLTGTYYDGNMQKRQEKFSSKSFGQLYSIIKGCVSYHPSLRYAKASILKNKLLSLQSRCSMAKINNLTTIAIAGSMTRIGVTHLSLMLTSYLGDKAVYIEENHGKENIGNLIPSLIKHNKWTKVTEHVIKAAGCNLLLQEGEEEYIRVIDYGVLTKENIEDFLSNNKKILVLGAKEWELAASEESLRLVAGRKDILYAFNFLDGVQFHTVLKNMAKVPCFRIPYEPNPFLVKNNLHISNFLANMIEDRY